MAGGSGISFFKSIFIPNKFPPKMLEFLGTASLLGSLLRQMHLPPSPQSQKKLLFLE